MTGPKLLCFFACLGIAVGAGDTYYIGTGRYDVTGPAAQIEMVSIASYA